MEYWSPHSYSYISLVAPGLHSLNQVGQTHHSILPNSCGTGVGISKTYFSRPNLYLIAFLSPCCPSLHYTRSHIKWLAWLTYRNWWLCHLARQGVRQTELQSETKSPLQASLTIGLYSHHCRPQPSSLYIHFLSRSWNTWISMTMELHCLVMVKYGQLQVQELPVWRVTFWCSILGDTLCLPLVKQTCPLLPFFYSVVVFWVLWPKNSLQN